MDDTMPDYVAVTKGPRTHPALGVHDQLQRVSTALRLFVFCTECSGSTHMDRPCEGRGHLDLVAERARDLNLFMELHSPLSLALTLHPSHSGSAASAGPREGHALGFRCLPAAPLRQ